ncbi:MAG: hypothetical protein IJK38_07760, partial [Oscillospiraceae bacterium]|nr:hypothetical protein [Oscillospiraceae bacterium]
CVGNKNRPAIWLEGVRLLAFLKVRKLVVLPRLRSLCIIFSRSCHFHIDNFAVTCYITTIS